MEENPYESPESEGQSPPKEGRPFGEGLVIALLGIVGAGLALLWILLFVRAHMTGLPLP